MLKLLSFERTEDESAMQQKYFVPASVLPSNLSTSIGALKQYLLNPPTLSDPKSLLRRASRRPPRKRRADLDSDDELPRMRRIKKAVETQIFKSAAFIDDSDDDEDADLAFFEREKKLREEMQNMAEASGHVMAKNGTKKRKRKDKSLAKIAHREAPTEVAGSQMTQGGDGDVAMGEEGDRSPSEEKRTPSLHSESEDSGSQASDAELSPRKATVRSGSLIASDSE